MHLDKVLPHTADGVIEDLVLSLRSSEGFSTREAYETVAAAQRKKKKDEKLTKRVTKQGSYSESVEETEPIDGADLDEEIEKAPKKARLDAEAKPVTVVTQSAEIIDRNDAHQTDGIEKPQRKLWRARSEKAI